MLFIHESHFMKNFGLEECSAPLGLDTWQSENQSVYYRQ